MLLKFSILDDLLIVKEKISFFEQPTIVGVSLLLFLYNFRGQNTL